VGDRHLKFHESWDNLPAMPAVSLMAALDVHNGEVLGRIIERNDSATFISFLSEIDQAIHPDTQIYLILDNGSSHRSKATKAWLGAHPRFTVCYTPVHASWLNQVVRHEVA